MNKKKGKRHIPPVKASAPLKDALVEYPSLDKILAGKGHYVFLVLAMVLVFIVFKNFILGTNLYLYKDIGCDTVTYWWPHWVFFSEYIHKLGVPKWSFNQGIGQNIYAFGICDPFSLIMCLLPKDTIPFAIVFMEIIKIIMGGFIFYYYLRMINISLTASIVGGLLYSFSGYMILGSGWYTLSTEALYAVMVLYSAEKFLRFGIWYLLPIPFCLLGIVQPFYIYLYGLLLIIYCIVRGLMFKQNLKTIVLSLFKMGGLGAFGVLLGSVVFFSNLALLIDNPRVTGNASLVKTLSATPMFTMSPPALNNIVINRLFSNDLLGAGSDFKLLSNFNYLEAPILYIGLITLLLAPQAFLFFGKRKRNIYLILTVVCLVPLVFIYFRMMFWLFSADYYRTYTFFISLLILFFALRALTFIDKTSVVHTKTLIASLFVLMFMLFHNFSGNPISQVDKNLREVVAIFLVIYTGLIYLLGNKKIKMYAFMGIGLCMCIELASFSSTTVNKRIVMTSEDLHNRKGYNDSSVEALSYIRAKDNSFYRVAKDYYSDAAKYICLNDPQIQDYKGTTEYAEWNQFNYVRFLTELHVPNYADPIYAKWLYGFTNRFMLNTLTSVKYMLSKQNSHYFMSIGFDSLTSYGNVAVMRNKYFLPFGYTYKKYISFPEFRKLPNDIEKDQMLLNACVPEDTNIAVFKGMQEQFAKDSLKPLTFEEYKACTGDLKKDSLTITHFDDNNIIGTIKADEKKLLFFSIPFDRGWKATVDGKPASTYRINIGFTGLMLDKGQHNVELHYVVPFLATGTYTSVAALLIYLLAFIRFRKTRF
jgi:uncharacterized membrane protein YfhO